MAPLPLIIDQTDHHLIEGLYFNIGREVFETISR